jgi:hypothetical protein
MPMVTPLELASSDIPCLDEVLAALRAGLLVDPTVLLMYLQELAEARTDADRLGQALGFDPLDAPNVGELVDRTIQALGAR